VIPFFLKDTWGNSWDANLPVPWNTRQLSVNGTTFAFTYPKAQAFALTMGASSRTFPW
jgi:hypothetical protein